MDDFDDQEEEDEAAGAIPADYLRLAAEAAALGARQVVDEEAAGNAGNAGNADSADSTSSPLPEPDTSMPKRGRGRPRKPPKLLTLEDEDPFILIETLDATGGVDGTRSRMSGKIMAIFRTYCLMNATARTHQRLRQQIERDGGVAPGLDTITSWSKKYGWPALLAEYDAALDRLRLARIEAARLEANDRQARVGRQMQQLSSVQMARLIQEYNAPLMPLRDPQSGKVLVNPRTGKPIFPPKKNLSGLQGLAVAYRIAVETERVALGLPTSISNTTMNERVSGDVNVTAQVTGSVQHSAVLTLDEWRRKSASERGANLLDSGSESYVRTDPESPSPSSGSQSSSPNRPLRALPAPERARTPDPVHAAQDAARGTSADPFFSLPPEAEGLTPEELASMPLDWFHQIEQRHGSQVAEVLERMAMLGMSPESVVDADPDK